MSIATSATSVAPDAPPDKTRVLLLAVRRALIMILCALEDYLEMDKTRR